MTREYDWPSAGLKRKSTAFGKSTAVLRVGNVSLPQIWKSECDGGDGDEVPETVGGRQISRGTQIQIYAATF